MITDTEIGQHRHRSRWEALMMGLIEGCMKPTKEDVGGHLVMFYGFSSSHVWM